MDFYKVLACDLKTGRYRQLTEFMKLRENSKSIVSF